MDDNPDLQYEGLSRPQQTVVGLYLLAAVWYLSWRIYTFNPDSILFSLVLYLAEVFGFVTACLHVFMVARLKVRVPEVPAPSATVDVFITTCNESVEIVHRTVLAAMNMDYPHNTWLLDDGNREQMRKLAEDAGCGYLARTTRDNAKAGNLNNAMSFTGGDFIAVFDADHAPKKNFLIKTLGYFRDPAVAFVQTPQDFYNLDSYQHRMKWSTRGMFTEQSLFFRVIQRGKDYWNAAFFCGSCAVLRRKALDEIGGFAVETVTEDLQTSIRLHKKGYSSVYHPESLAFGIAPVSVEAFLTQRLRWGTGALQVWRKEGVLTARGLTLAQKANYLASMLTYFDGWQKLVFYMTPAIVLYTQVMPISTSGWEFIAHLIPYYVLTYWVFEEVGRGYGHSIYIEQYNMARFAIFIQSTLAGLADHARFAVTPKTNNSEMTAFKFMLPQYLVFVINATAIALALSRTQYGGQLSGYAVAFNVFWSGINIWLSYALLLFTVRLPVRRHDYRFPLMLPAKVAVHASAPHGFYAMVKNITKDGIRINLQGLSTDSMVGKAVSGTVILPDGGADFNGSIVCMHQKRDGSIDLGCEVEWRTASGQQRVERLLYGSDLQLRINGLHEDTSTPLRLLARMLRRQTARPSSLAHAWRARLIRIAFRGDIKHILVVVGPQDRRGRQHMITSEYMEVEQVIVLHAPESRSERWRRRVIVSAEQIETPLATLYLYEMMPVMEVSDVYGEKLLADNAGLLAYTSRGRS